MPDLVPVDQVTPSDAVSLVDALRYAIGHADQQRQALAEQGDVEALGYGLRDLRRLAADLRLLTQSTEDDVARLMPTKTLVVDGLGTLERRKGTDRKKWQSTDLLAHIINLAALDRETGELYPPEVTLRRLLEVLPEVVPFTGSLGWRVTALRGLGVDPDQWCETAPGRVTVTVHQPDREGTDA